MRGMHIWAGLGIALMLALAPRLARTADKDDPDPRLLLVLPIFGERLPEMELPWAEHLTESLLLALPEGSMLVEAQEPTGPVLPGTVEQIARQRGAQLGAQAVMWGELVQPGPCRAPRMIRLRILELQTEKLLTRELCPEGAGRDDISRAISLTVVHALRAGEFESLHSIDRKQPKLRKTIRRIPKVPKCPDPEPCPDCPSPCPDPAPAWRSPLFISAAAAYSSHPGWQSYGLGGEVGFAWAPVDWFEIGLGLQAMRGRSIELDEVHALYSSWPLGLWLGFRLQIEPIELVLSTGAHVAFSRLDVLLERLELATSVERINPTLFVRAAMRIWTPWGFGIQLNAGPTFFLRRQRYTYGTTSGTETVLSMQTTSLEAGVGLVVPIRL